MPRCDPDAQENVLFEPGTMLRLGARTIRSSCHATRSALTPRCGARSLHSSTAACDNWLPWEDARKISSRERRFGGAHGFPDWVEKYVLSETGECGAVVRWWMLTPRTPVVPCVVFVVCTICIRWGRGPFYKVGAAGTALSLGTMALAGPFSFASAAVTLPVAAYWLVGLRDINQPSHALKRNFPVLANIRYFLETIRPEIRQYLVESDDEAVPFSRLNRSVVYQRSKKMVDTMPFGARADVYEEGYEWINHSIFTHDVSEEASRVLVGGRGCTQPYSAALLNISAMSYGALSSNAILALNTAAQMGGFYHNTGEGGVSEFHLAPGGDIVWNVGTGYFGCRAADGTFDADKFVSTSQLPQIKMIELKLSQGAKPGHGGILPASKLTPTIAAARGVPLGQDCESPARHSVGAASCWEG